MKNCLIFILLTFLWLPICVIQHFLIGPLCVTGVIIIGSRKDWYVILAILFAPVIFAGMMITGICSLPIGVLEYFKPKNWKEGFEKMIKSNQYQYGWGIAKDLGRRSC